MNGKTFRFPTVQNVFSPDQEEAKSVMTSEVDDSLTYPYLPEYRFQMDVELNKGILVQDLGVIGISSMLGIR